MGYAMAQGNSDSNQCFVDTVVMGTYLKKLEIQF